MNGLLLLVAALMVLITACRPATPIESPEFLAAHPARLKAVTRACRDHEPEMNAAMCAAAAEAERRRFMGEGTYYSPRTIDAASPRRAKE